MSLILVGGAMRTGTSLVQGVLCSGPETNPVIHEAHYLARLFGLYPYGLSTWDDFLGHYFADAEAFRAYSRQQITTFLDGLRPLYGDPPNLVLKSPELTPVMPVVPALLPEARFVIVVRDPRDAVCSMLQAAERQRARGRTSNLTQMGRDMRAFATHYLSYYMPVFNSGDRDFLARVMLLKYEDLLADTETAVERLRAHTGLALADFDPAAPWSHNRVDFAGAEARNEPFASPLRGQPLSSSRVGRFRDDLSRAEAAEIERICAVVMEHFGYEAGAADG